MMSNSFGKFFVCLPLLAAAMALGNATTAFAQFGGGLFQQIGGVRVDASGILGLATESELGAARERILARLGDVDTSIRESVKLRAVSLRGLEAALQQALDSGEPIPDEIRFLAGIQRIQYVIADPESGDILIAGPGEGWITDKAGNVVGETTGRPVLQLEDFIVALRTADDANREYGISVSINPTEEGRAGYDRVKRQIRASGQPFRPEMSTALEEAMGPQEISLTGLPENSRMAQVLAAADFRMKRLAMGFEAAPVAGLPSVLEIARDKGRPADISPRFWLECDYDSVKKSADGLTWQISGPGAKALTESEVATAAGENRNGKDHPIATEWAETMTEKFAELADADPVFAELQNVMDMAVAAAILEKYGLLETAGLEAPCLTGANEDVELPAWHTPKTVASQCSFVQIGDAWMVTTSGGVQVDSWKVLDNVEVDESLASIAKSARSASSDAAWWNAVN
jgi:hypothetical protein